MARADEREDMDRDADGERTESYVDAATDDDTTPGNRAADDRKDPDAAMGPKEAEDEWSRIEAELAETRDRHLRLAAEFENYRKRTREELLQSGTRAQARLVGSLLDVLDDFDRIVGMDPGQVTAESVIDGARLVERKLKRVLDDAGVERIDPEGERFDPERMEAVMREPTESESEDDLVSRVFQKGVIFKGHLVRPARVAVLKVEE